MNAIKQGATKIRHTFNKNVYDDDYLMTRYIVSYLIEDVWHEIMFPPIKLHATMMSRLKLMANIPLSTPEPCHGKIFFRHTHPLIEFNDVIIHSVTDEELFLIDFQIPLNSDSKPIVVELTWVPSKHQETSEKKA